MRRVLAITALAALVLSTGLPVWASACTSMNHGQAPLCHRAGMHQHHCEQMEEQQGETAASSSETAFTGHSTECPMHCCMQLQAGNGTAIQVTSSLPQLAVSEYQTEFSTIIFLSNGYSSHTDRGPPSLS